MSKLSSEEEKQLIVFVKDWLKSHGFSQTDLAAQLRIRSSRTSEITKKLKDLHKRGGIINIAKNLIKIEQYWINNNNNKKENNNEEYSFSEENKRQGYNQLDFNYKLDLDELMDQMEKDHKIN
tara:strand:+ start:1034 stop:1402 length:369 start_codon:yes stop_codon:yes gene_type:complete